MHPNKNVARAFRATFVRFKRGTAAVLRIMCHAPNDIKINNISPHLIHPFYRYLCVLSCAPSADET
jgi:hypothetical protein